MSKHAPILIRFFLTDTFEEGELVEGITFSEIKSTQRQWLEFLHADPDNAGTRREHKHWNWVHKARYARSRRRYQFLGIACEGQMQGLMLVSDDHLSRIANQSGEPLIYIDYVSAAPWNLRGVTRAPRFAGIGRNLLSAAIRFSITRGWEGRIGLHSLPQADSFYERTCGMTNLGTDAAEEGLRYFEMTPDQARNFLEGQKL